MKRTLGAVILIVMWVALCGFGQRGYSSSGGAAGSVATDTIWTAKGQVVGGTGTGTAAVLAAGSDNYVLTTDSSTTNGLKWTAALTNPMSAAGDMIYGGTGGATTRLAKGSANALLAMDSAGTGVNWTTTINVSIDDSAAQFYKTGDTTAKMGLGVGSVSAGVTAWIKPTCTSNCILGTPTLTGNGDLVVTGTTGTGLVATTGVMDGLANTYITTASTTLTTNSGRMAYFFNNNASTIQAVTYTLTPSTSTSAGMQYCFKQYSGCTGKITVAPGLGQTIDHIGTATSGASTVTSTGALGDGLCVISATSIKWVAYISYGSWLIQ